MGTARRSRPARSRATTRSKVGCRGAPRASAYLSALRILAQRRQTESQLFARLLCKGYDGETVASAIERCKAEGYVDDRLFATLFVEGRVKALGNARLVAELVRRGVARESALDSVAASERDEEARLGHALEKLFRTRPGLSYPSAARALERLGFPAAAIYRRLRHHVQTNGDVAAED